MTLRRITLALAYASGMVAATALIILFMGSMIPLVSPFVFLLPISVAAHLWGLGIGVVATMLSAGAAYLLLQTSPGGAAAVSARAAAALIALGSLNAVILARLRSLDQWRASFRLSEGLIELSHAAAVANQRTEHAEEGVRIAAKSEQFQRVLLDTLAHDLKTPLTSILGAVSVLRDDPTVQSKRDTQELAALAYEETQRLVRLIADITHMAELEGGVRPRRELSDMKDILDAAMRELREGLAGRACRLVVAPGLPLVTGDPGLLIHVFTNILANAIKYSPEGAPIDLVIEPGNAGHLQISVADRGIGVPLGDLERIFERQHQSGPRAGQGLGLAIAKGIVDAHEGEISAAAREGGGTVVKVILPVH